MPPKPDHWRRVTIAVWVVALVILGGKALLLPYRNTVYPIFAGAGRHWLDSADLYETPPGQDPYRYSPLVAAFFVPFSQLPDAVAGLLWRLLIAVIFCGGLAWWCRAVLPPNLTRAQRALLFLLPTPLAFANLHNGQANILIIGLLILAIAAIARSRFSLAAVLVATACVFKLYPIAIGLLLALLYRRRFAPRLALALTAGLALPFLLQRPDYVATQYGHWVEHLANNDRQLMPRAYWYRDARLLCSLWVTPMSYGAYQVWQGIGAAVVAVACLWARRTGLPQARLLTLLLGLGCCWMTVLGPATESSTYVLLGPTAAWLVLGGSVEGHSIGLRIVWATGYGLLVASQVASTLPGGLGRVAQALGPQPLAALLLFGGLLYLAFRRRVRPGATPQAA
jgi:hypothetical protein